MNKTEYEKKAKRLQERLVQTCIDFLKEEGDNDIWAVEFNVDDLQESKEHGQWCPSSDSYIRLIGLKFKNEDDKFPKHITLAEYL